MNVVCICMLLQKTPCIVVDIYNNDCFNETIFRCLLQLSDDTVFNPRHCVPGYYVKPMWIILICRLKLIIYLHYDTILRDYSVARKAISCDFA